MTVKKAKKVKGMVIHESSEFANLSPFVRARDYTARVKILGTFFSGTGATVRDAIADITVPKAQGVSILAVTHGENTQEKVFGRPLTRRLFSPSKLMRDAAIKHASECFTV